jgi:hypothetical protein
MDDQSSAPDAFSIDALETILMRDSGYLSAGMLKRSSKPWVPHASQMRVPRSDCKCQPAAHIRMMHVAFLGGMEDVTGSYPASCTSSHCLESALEVSKSSTFVLKPCLVL